MAQNSPYWIKRRQILEREAEAHGLTLIEFTPRAEYKLFRCNRHNCRHEFYSIYAHPCPTCGGNPDNISQDDEHQATDYRADAVEITRRAYD